MIKKINVLLSVAIALCLFSSNIKAEDYSNKEYWDKLCNPAPSSIEDKKACDGYWAHVIEESEQKIEDMNNAIKDLEKDYEAAKNLANQYIKEVQSLKTQISQKQNEINNLQREIDALQIKIDDNNKKIDELNKKVLGRMKSKQSIMHFDSFIDFIFGSDSFDQMLRRSYGLSAIMESDNNLKDEIQETLRILKEDKEKLNTSKATLIQQKEVLDSKKAECEKMVEFQERAMIIADEKMDEIRAAQDKEGAFLKDAEEKRKELGAISASKGLITPLSNFYISAGFPYYPASFGGGLHLGVDYAASVGTNVVAPANGIIYLAANGCDTWGYLGNSCGYQIGGSSGGGNQISMVMAAGGVLYGMSVFHLKKDSIAVQTGEIVLQGQYLAQVGSSGNSTGPHAHIELFYLGKGDPSDIPDVIKKYNSQSFGCGWGWAAKKRICTNNGFNAPCRLDSREYF